MIDPDDILRSGDVCELCDMSRSLLKYRQENMGFPRPIKSFEEFNGRTLNLWDRRAVLAWLELRDVKQYRRLKRAKRI